MTLPLIPTLITIGAGLLLLSKRNASSTGPSKGGGGAPVDPNHPIPRPDDLPPPSPTPNADVLRQELGALLAQADDPMSTIDPNALLALGVALDGAGLHTEANQARAKAAEILVRRGGGAFPGPLGGPSPFPGPVGIPPMQGMPGMGVPGMQPPVGAPPPSALGSSGTMPTILPADLQARAAPYLDPNSSGLDPNAAVKLADYIEAVYPGGFLTLTAALRKRAADLGGAA